MNYTIFIFLFCFLPSIIYGGNKFCEHFVCDDKNSTKVCGLRTDGEGYRIRLFRNECDFLNIVCSNDTNREYSTVDMEYCDSSFLNNNTDLDTGSLSINKTPNCPNIDCSYPSDAIEVCGIRETNNGYIVRLFINKCEMYKLNCMKNINFIATEIGICRTSTLKSNISGIRDKITATNEIEDVEERFKNKPLFLVDGWFNINNNVNDTINNFFDSTHMFDMPLKQVNHDDLSETRRRLVKIFKPVLMFEPAVNIPDVIKNDTWYLPTLKSCYHRCPTKCPETYAPVCGNPGNSAREPTLMFRNHCFMDVAQCNMRWATKSPTVNTSYYIESSFMFCLGEQMNALYRFLPLVRTLQHAGRMKKGKFNYKVKNMRFFNNYLNRDARFMG